MDLYLHMIIAHMGLFYEKMDFQNTNTEGGESWLGWAKKILKLCTNKDLSSDQPLRELCVRHHFRGGFYQDCSAPYDPMKSKIAKEFKKHNFEEVEILIVDDNREDVEAFLKYLDRQGYTEEDECWRREGEKITFNTVKTAQQAYEQFHSG